MEIEMSKRKIKLTRKEKIKMNPHGSGNSKYAKKLKKRRKLAQKLDLSLDTTYPQMRP